MVPAPLLTQDCCGVAREVDADAIGAESAIAAALSPNRGAIVVSLVHMMVLLGRRSIPSRLAAGIGTVVLAAAGMHFRSTGIQIYRVAGMPEER
jgi:hypothetical protein